MADGPVRQHSATASPSDAQPVGIRPATGDQLVDSSHQILMVVPWIFVLNNVSEFLSIAGGAARIRVQHYVALCCHPLEFVVESVAVGGVWAAVNIQNQRIFPRRIKIGRTLYPSLDAPAVKALVPDHLRLRNLELGE